MTPEPWGAYVHVPWCRIRCPYCAFYVVPGGEPIETDVEARFVTRVLGELAEWSPSFAGPQQSVYLGGGTPSRLSPRGLATLVRGLRQGPEVDVSAEANPEDLTDDWLAAALAAGLTRVSVGVQSFQDAVARRLGRAHTARQAVDACRRTAAASLASWSVDLIFAVPGQSLADLDADLDRVLDLGAPHVSVYGLTIEADTPFARAQQRGRLVETPPDDWRRMYDRLVERLTQAGVARYEVSNFARKGHESRHNRLYWTDGPYMGLGPGAHGYTADGRRWLNAPSLPRYLAEAPAPRTVTTPDPRDQAIDLVVSSLRGVGGLDRARMRRRTGLDVHDGTVATLVTHDLMWHRGDRVGLTHEGFPVADGVVRRLLDTLCAAASGTSGGPLRLG